MPINASGERKKYGITLAQNMKVFLDEMGIDNKLISVSWGAVTFRVDTEITDDHIIKMYKRTDVNHVDYHVERKELTLGIEMPPVLGQYA